MADLNAFRQILRAGCGLLLLAPHLATAQTPPRFISAQEWEESSDPALGMEERLIPSPSGYYLCPLESQACIRAAEQLVRNDTRAAQPSLPIPAPRPSPHPGPASEGRSVRLQAEAPPALPPQTRPRNQPHSQQIHFDDDSVEGQASSAEGEHLLSWRRPTSPHCSAEWHEFQRQFRKGVPEAALPAARTLARCFNPCLTDRDLENQFSCEGLEAYLRGEGELAAEGACGEAWQNEQVLLGRREGGYRRADGTCHRLLEEISFQEHTQRRNFEVDLVLLVDGSGSMQSAGRAQVQRILPRVIDSASAYGQDLQVHLVSHEVRERVVRNFQEPITLDVSQAGSRARNLAKAREWLDALYSMHRDPDETQYRALLANGRSRVRPEADVLGVILTDEEDLSFAGEGEARFALSPFRLANGENRLIVSGPSLEQFNREYSDYIRTLQARGVPSNESILAAEFEREHLEASRTNWSQVGAELVDLQDIDSTVRAIDRTLARLVEPGFTSRRYLTARERSLLRNGQLLGVFVDGELLSANDYRYDTRRGALLFNRRQREDAAFTLRIAIHPSARRVDEGRSTRTERLDHRTRPLSAARCRAIRSFRGPDTRSFPEELLVYLREDAPRPSSGSSRGRAPTLEQWAECSAPGAHMHAWIQDLVRNPVEGSTRSRATEEPEEEASSAAESAAPPAGAATN